MIKNVWEHWQTTAVAIAGVIVWMLPQIFPHMQIDPKTTTYIGQIIFFGGLIFSQNFTGKKK